LGRASRNRAELGTCVRITERPNKELKLTKPGTIGASQLNSSVRQTCLGSDKPMTTGSRFPGRQLKPYSEPVSPAELHVGATYFHVGFLDDSMLIPTVEPIVFIGRDLAQGGPPGELYFQDAASYGRGVRHESAVDSDGSRFIVQPAEQVGPIFEFERALDLLLACSLRRGKHAP
jgi:hypothetical protein